VSVSSKAGVLRIRPGATAAELRQHLMRLCEDLNYNPLEALIDMATNGYPVELEGEMVRAPLDPKDAIAIHKEIAGYIMPKLRTIDVKEKVDVDVHITVQKFGDVKTIEGEATMIRDVVDESKKEEVDVENLGSLNKEDLVQFAKDSLGLELSMQHTKPQLLEKIEEAIAAESGDDDEE